MPIYAVSYYTSEGTYKKREIEADTEAAAKGVLRKEGLFPTGAKVLKKSSRISSIKLNVREQIELFEQLELYLGAGVLTADALDEIRNAAAAAKVRLVADAMYKSLATAKRPLSECFEQFPASFPASVVAVIRVGETNGADDLALVFGNIKERIEYDEQAKAEIKRGISYPIFLCCMAFGLVVLTMLYFVPKAAELLKELNAPMPIYTLRVIAVANFLLTYWPAFVGLFFTPAILRMGRRVPGFAHAMDKLFLRMPVFGRIYCYLATAQFAHYYNSLRTAGNNTDTILHLCVELSPNLAWQAAIRRIRERVTVTGKQKLWVACSEEPFFPEPAISLIKVGEERGCMEKVFKSIAGYYSRTARESINAMLRWLTPVVTITVGVFIFTILGCLFAPIFTILTNIG
jgi:type IV pilus assembly protein PilC